MKKLIDYIRRKLSVRVSLWVVLFAAVVFMAALGFMFVQARDAVRQEAINRASQILDNTALRVSSILNRVETASDMTKWLVLRHPETPDSMFTYSKGILRNNPNLFNCSIAFEPYFYQKYGRYFSAYSKHEGDSIRTIQGGSDAYQYFYMDWFLMPKLLERPCWTEPYMDLDVSTNTKEMLTSYCNPIKDKNGDFIGVINTGLSLSWLSQTISAVKPYPNSYSIMVGHGGTYFVHPDTTKLLNQTIFTETLERPDTALEALGHAMQRGEEGMKELMIDGQDCYVFFKPLGSTNWTMAIVCPESDIFYGLNRMQRSITLIFILGLLLMLYVCSQIVSRELKPLSQLTRQIETISSGQLDQELPDNGRTDELGRLYKSFSDMQHSLVSYIDKMKQTTAAKAAIENELKVASDIQMSMVPRIFPAFPSRDDIDLYASMTPAKEVGGDLYDFFVQDETMYFCVGDVSGKGVPASLFMAVTRNLFRIFAQQGHNPESIATAINQFLSQDNNQNMFVTMFIGQIDLNTERMDFCNCGHNPPVLVVPGQPAQFLPIQYTNQPLGIMDGIPFRGESLADMRGKLLLIYTDGLNEAENPRHEQYGDDAVLEMLTQLGSLSAEEVISRLKESVEKHRAGAAPNDDLTLFCFRLK